jgi:hypothetical protein
MLRSGWGCSWRVETQVLETELEVFGVRICGMVGDMKKESVLRGGTAFFLLRWFVLVDEACFEKVGCVFRMGGHILVGGSRTF